MRAQPKVKSAFTSTGAAIVTTTELAVVTIGNVANQSPDGVVRLLGSISLATGTGVTSITVRIRRGSGIAGIIVGAAYTQQIGASLQTSIEIAEEDSPGEVGGVPYTLTVQQAGATGNGAILTAQLQAIT